MLRAAVLHSLLRRIQRFSTSGHPEALVACYAASWQLPRLDFHQLADDSLQDTPCSVGRPSHCKRRGGPHIFHAILDWVGLWSSKNRTNFQNSSEPLRCISTRKCPPLRMLQVTLSHTSWSCGSKASTSLPGWAATASCTAPWNRASTSSNYAPRRSIGVRFFRWRSLLDNLISLASQQKPVVL